MRVKQLFAAGLLAGLTLAPTLGGEEVEAAPGANCAEVYTVRAGQGLGIVAARNGLTNAEFLGMNPEFGGNIYAPVRIGQAVCVEAVAANTPTPPRVTAGPGTAPTASPTQACKVEPSVIRQLGDRDANLERNEARQLQSALAANGSNPGPIDGLFGGRSFQALRDFQARNGLRVDCILGQATFRRLNISTAPATSAAPTNIDRVVVDLSDDRLVAFDDGVQVLSTPISHGDGRRYTYRDSSGRTRTGVATTHTGNFRVFRQEGPLYSSRTLGGAPGSMGNARFYNGGEAIHKGNIYGPSHGCVRVPGLSMQNLVDMGFGFGDRVTIQE